MVKGIKTGWNGKKHSPHYFQVEFWNEKQGATEQSTAV